ncbi:MAG: cystathionine gamma-lyase [Micrococcus sp.]|nr:cystathionine gamma-lyase [Micrococcus sp.]
MTPARKPARRRTSRTRIPPRPVDFAEVLHHRVEGLAAGEPISPPIVHASAFHLPGSTEAANQYGRWDNGTWRALEEALGVLEDAETAMFPSGMAAIAAVLLSQLRPGQRALLPLDGYGATQAMARQYLVPSGIHVDFCFTPQIPERDLEGYDLVFVESPSNPLLRVIDIAQLAERAHAAGALLVVDNTMMTPLGQRPLELGADVVVASDTKALAGHTDVLGGHVASKNGQLMVGVRHWRTLTGGILGPMEAWLIHRGLDTLEVRLERMWSTAQALGEMLESLGGQFPFTSVVFPGLDSHPDAEIVAAQMAGPGSLVGVEFETAEIAERFLAASRYLVAATSFGGTHSSAERRARWDDDVQDGYVRISVGCEPTPALLEDVVLALQSL